MDVHALVGRIIHRTAGLLTLCGALPPPAGLRPIALIVAATRAALNAPSPCMALTSTSQHQQHHLYQQGSPTNEKCNRQTAIRWESCAETGRVSAQQAGSSPKDPVGMWTHRPNPLQMFAETGCTPRQQQLLHARPSPSFSLQWADIGVLIRTCAEGRAGGYNSGLHVWTRYAAP